MQNSYDVVMLRSSGNHDIDIGLTKLLKTLDIGSTKLRQTNFKTPKILCLKSQTS